MARAWWMWGKPEETAHALLSAYDQAPSEVRDRPTIRKIADNLAMHHPRVSGVRELAAAIGGNPPIGPGQRVAGKTVFDVEAHA